MLLQGQRRIVAAQLSRRTCKQQSSTLKKIAVKATFENPGLPLQISSPNRLLQSQVGVVGYSSFASEVHGQATPASALLDHPFEFGESLEGNAEGELNASLVQSRNNLITEEGTNTCFWLHKDLLRRSSAYNLQV